MTLYFIVTILFTFGIFYYIYYASNYFNHYLHRYVEIRMIKEQIRRREVELRIKGYIKFELQHDLTNVKFNLPYEINFCVDDNKLIMVVKPKNKW